MKIYPLIFCNVTLFLTLTIIISISRRGRWSAVWGEQSTYWFLPWVSIDLIPELCVLAAIDSREALVIGHPHLLGNTYFARLASPQVLNQGLKRQCTCAGGRTYLGLCLYQANTSAHPFDTLGTGLYLVGEKKRERNLRPYTWSPSWNQLDNYLMLMIISFVINSS